MQRSTRVKLLVGLAGPDNDQRRSVPERPLVADGDSTRELLIVAGAGTRRCSETGLGDAQGDNSKRHLSAAVVIGSSGGSRRKAEHRDGEQSWARRESRR
jgi:hypothetical protein